MDLPANGEGASASNAVAIHGTLPKLPWLENKTTKLQADEDADSCRICRGEGTVEQPLFYPCKCSGSIRFVHQDCLMEWLSHSQKKYCELCKTPFTFTKLYDRSMPDKLPLHLFLRQIVIHSARGVLKWARILMVGFVWLGWLPWSIRQVWRALFWLADGSWALSTGMGAAAVAAVNTTASSLDNDTSPLVGSLTYTNSSNIAFRTALVTSIPEIFAPISAFLTFSTDDFLVVKLMRLLFPNLLHWITRLFSESSQLDEPVAQSRSTRLPSLLSDLTYFETLTTHPVVNNAVVDVLEGQFICLLIVTAFILVFLIREWVINQQPIANIPDPDRVDEAPAPLQVNRNLRPVPRRRRRGLREVPEQRGPGQNPGRPLLDNVPRPAGNPTDAEGEYVDTSAQTSIEQDPQQTEVQSLADCAGEGTPLETIMPSFARPRRPESPQPTPEARPTLQSRNALDQAADIRRKIEEGTAGLENLDILSPSHGIEHDGVWSDNHESRSKFYDLPRGTDDEGDFEMASLALRHDQHEPGTTIRGETPVLGTSDLLEELVLPLHDAELLQSHIRTRGGEPQSSDESIFQNLQTVATPETSSTERGAPPSDTDEERVLETPESTSDEDEPPAFDDDNTVNARNNFWDHITDWLWHTDENVGLAAAAINESNEHLIQDVDLELPFVPARLLQQDDVPDDEALGGGRAAEAARPQPDNPLGVDFNNPDAIEEAEDLDGILELIGVQGPITGMMQNVIFSEFLITLTIAASVWLPYIWGKIALLILANPIGMFLKAPLHLASSAADTTVDIMLFIAALAIFAINSCLSLLVPWLAYVRPGWASVMEKSFMGKSLAVADKSLTLAKGSGARLEKALSVTFFGLRPDLPTFSIVSHQALRTFEQKLNDTLSSFTTISASFLQHYPSELQGVSYGSSQSSNGDPVSIGTFAGAIREKALIVSSYTIQSLKTIVIDLSSTSSAQSEPLDYALIRWGTRDKILAIVLGYIFLSIIGYLYLKISRLVFGLKAGDKVEGMVADALNQAGGVMKVILIIGIEMIVFPLYCGMLLDVALMPLFAGATFESRLAFTMEAPMTALFVHWFVGTCYMFHFALFVSMCRKIMRNGVLYFIRDPDDPTFHPVRDVLERPVLGQLSKIAFSAIVYGGLVMLCLGGVIWALTCIDGILPINWVTNEPKLELPVDVIFYNFFLPILIRKIEPSKKIATMWEWWFRGCASGLRLTHFLFGEVREDERRTSQGRAWNLFINDKADLQLDGTFVRAPASDSVRIPKGERVFLEVTEKNERMDGLDDKDDGPHGKANKNFTKVYIPPNFRARIATFIVMIWLFAATTGLLFTIVPLLLGRGMITYLLQVDQTPNDLYAFTVGLHVCGGIAYAAAYYRVCKEWLVAKASTLFADTRQILPKIRSGVVHLLGLTYIFTTFGIVLPLLFSVTSELYFLMPLYTYLSSNSPSDITEDGNGPVSDLPTTIHILQTWTLGLLYLRLALRFATGHPNRRTQAAIAIRAILQNGILHPDVRLATRAFVVPALVVSAMLLAPPLGLGFMINAVLDVHEAELRMKVYRYAYPGLMAGVLASYCAVLLKRQIGVWRVRIRDEVYLIGERLHNFGEGGKSVRTVAQRGFVAGMERVDVEIR